MAVDWRNKSAILDAWKKVTEHEDGYDFFLLSYDGKSTTLKLVSSFSFIFFFQHNKFVIAKECNVNQ